jgi:hypothetical protein
VKRLIHFHLILLGAGTTIILIIELTKFVIYIIDH